MWISATLATRVWSKVRAAKSDKNCLLLGIAPNIRIHAVTVTRSLPSTWLLHPRLMRLLRLLSLRCDCCVGALVHQCGLLAMSKPVRGSTNRIPILILFFIVGDHPDNYQPFPPLPRVCVSRVAGGRWSRRASRQESTAHDITSRPLSGRT